MYVKHVRLNAFIKAFTVQYRVNKSSIDNMNFNSKSLNKEFIRFNSSIYKVLHIKLPKNSIYNYFKLNCTAKV